MHEYLFFIRAFVALKLFEFYKSGLAKDAMKNYSRNLPSLNFALLITASADEVCDVRNDAMKYQLLVT